MAGKETFANNILQLNESLSKVLLELPDGFRIINPFNGPYKDQIKQITMAFYKKYYNDINETKFF